VENKFSGKFIVLDGPDGCGKTVQTKLLADWLKEQGVAVESFRDPGGTDIGEKIRQILLNPEHIQMSTRSELLLYMAARTQLWEEKIAPAFKKNKCVILDRWLSSTCAYQGCAGGFGIENVIKIAKDCLERPWPDLTVILDVNPETAAKRLKRTPDRMERKSKGYHQKVRDGFLKLAKGRRSFVIIDAANDIETIHKQIIDAVEKVF
jgi:dTMP kinase